MSGSVATGASYSKNVATTYAVSGPKIIQVNNITASGNAPFIAFVPYSDPAEPYAQAEAVYDITLSANCAISFLSGSAVGIVQRLTLILRQPASGSTFTATLPSNVNYPGGSPPSIGTAAGSATVITFTTTDNGATVFATESATFSSVVKASPAVTPKLAQPVAFANLHTDPAALTLASAATAGNHAIVLAGSYDRDAVLPSGWTQVALGSEQSSAHVSAWQAPVSALTSNGVSIGGNQYGGGYLIETTATAFDGAVIDGGSNNSPSFTFNPVAATKANAQRFALVFGYVGTPVTPTVTGATILEYLMGADGGGSAFTILLSIPDGSTAPITVTMANINASDVGVAFVNGYAA